MAENDYSARVCVILFESIDLPEEPLPSLVVTESAMIPIERDSGPAVGYYRELGFRCAADDVLEMIDYAVGDGEVHWGRTEWHETAIDAALDHDAIWYRGAREYFRRW